MMSNIAVQRMSRYGGRSSEGDVEDSSSEDVEDSGLEDVEDSCSEDDVHDSGSEVDDIVLIVRTRTNITQGQLLANSATAQIDIDGSYRRRRGQNGYGHLCQVHASYRTSPRRPAHP